MFTRIPIPPGFQAFPRAALEGSVPDRFRRQVELHRSRPAVSSLEGSVSYGELDGMSNRVAGALIERLGPGRAPVAIVAGQNHRLIAGVLGTLKTGRPYLPLSPRWEPDRIAEVLRDAGTVLLLGEASTIVLARAAARDVCDVMILEDAPDADPGPPTVSIDPGSPASLYYTSGSTGRAKGVADSHRSILHNVLRYTNSLGFHPGDRLTLLQGAHFSGASSSMFGALLNGGCVCPFDVPGNTPARLAEFLAEQRVTVYHSVPTVFRSFLPGDRRFPDVRVIRLEGDQASHRDVELFRRHFDPPVILVNGLGATEAGLIRQYVVDHELEVCEGILPVGYPVEDMDVVLLDPSGGLVSPGDSGEIAVRSRYLALGYWQRPDLTATAFQPDPSDAGSRLYHTGDLGRMRPDGCLEYLGRRDTRVKIRGQTVELADVESELIRIPGVREAAVVPFTAADGEQALAAYLVPARTLGPIAELQRSLARSLPAHAIPARYLTLEALPLSENLKVDRSALPKPGADRPDAGPMYVAPANALESILVQIWESLLDLRPVGTRDDWLALGGDSLRAVRMIEQIQEALGQPVQLSVLLEARTVEQLARAVLQEQPADLRQPVVSLNAGGTRPPFYFLHGDYWSDGVYCLPLARLLSPEQPLVLLPPAGLDGRPAPRSIEEMAEHHVRVLTEVQRHGPYRLGGNCNGGQVAYEMARLLRRRGEQVERLVMVRSLGHTIQLWLPDRLARGIAAARLLGGTHPIWRRRLIQFGAAWSRADARGRLRLLRSQVARFPRLIRREEVAPEGNGADRPWRERLRDIYMQAAREYVPGPYDGTVTLCWPEHDGETPEAARDWWRRVARSVDLRVLPGDHLSYVTVHAEAFARVLTEVLG